MANNTICSVEGCGNQSRTKGLCPKHYYRLLRHGDPLKTIKPANGDVLRYLNATVRTYEGSDCLSWPYSRSRGYAVLGLNGKTQYVCRVLCEEDHGAAPDPAAVVAHSCGNGHLGCVTRRHLRWATKTENQQDRRAHGTYQFGSKNPSAKLTEDDVRNIRALIGTEYQRDIARQFGVSRELISSIARKKAWGWLI